MLCIYSADNLSQIVNLKAISRLFNTVILPWFFLFFSKSTVILQIFLPWLSYSPSKWSSSIRCCITVQSTAIKHFSPECHCQQTCILTKNRDVVFDEECYFIIWNVTQEIKSLAECTLHQTDSVSCQHSISYLQCSFSVIIIIIIIIIIGILIITVNWKQCILESVAKLSVRAAYVARPLPWQHRKSIFSVAWSTLPSLAATGMRNALAAAACYRERGTYVLAIE